MYVHVEKLKNMARVLYSYSNKIRNLLIKSDGILNKSIISQLKCINYSFEQSKG
jgi:hypothetical protein